MQKLVRKFIKTFAVVLLLSGFVAVKEANAWCWYCEWSSGYPNCVYSFVILDPPFAGFTCETDGWTWCWVSGYCTWGTCGTLDMVYQDQPKAELASRAVKLTPDESDALLRNIRGQLDPDTVNDSGGGSSVYNDFKNEYEFVLTP